MPQLKEEWKPIKGYERKYLISNTGNIKNSKGKLIKPNLKRGGYWGVNLHPYTGSMPKAHYVHRLVLLHFSERVKGHDIINHIDENKLNNIITNLEWSTNVKNSAHSKVNLLKRKAVSQYSLSGRLIKYWPGIIFASKATGIIRQNISACANGKRKNAGGFIWK